MPSGKHDVYLRRKSLGRFRVDTRPVYFEIQAPQQIARYDAESNRIIIDAADGNSAIRNLDCIAAPVKKSFTNRIADWLLDDVTCSDIPLFIVGVISAGFIALISVTALIKMIFTGSAF